MTHAASSPLSPPSAPQSGTSSPPSPGGWNLREKLLALILSLSLLPLAGISYFSYFLARETITEDRIRLFLEQIAQDTVDKIDLTLLEKLESVRAMAVTFNQELLLAERKADLVRTLNLLVQTHEVYDLILVLDPQGLLLASNTQDRFGLDISGQVSTSLSGRQLSWFPSDYRWFERALTGHPAQSDWYSSDLVQAVYHFQDADISQQYTLGFSEPLLDAASGKFLGVCITLMNWAYIQDILDNVERDLQRLGFPSGYAFLFKRDANTIIGHKYRGKRTADASGLQKSVPNNYGTRLVEDHGLREVHQAALLGRGTIRYRYPADVLKISGLARINNNAFGWICGVGINDEDIFHPVQVLKYVFISSTLILGALVVGLTLLFTRGITIPLKRLTETAERMSRGNLEQRVPIESRDELGSLATAFNNMAVSLLLREEQLSELTRNLEAKVQERTVALERSNEALRRAYLELQNTQEHLVQSEKMASLGQLVAGIAHEIKNPLNFIYGNTGFLKNYIDSIISLIAELENLPSLSREDKVRITGLKEHRNYDFIVEDLDTLIENFSEGARRIHNIVSDLRSFSRMDPGPFSEVDIHTTLEVALNLLSNQYRDRIQIHREYGTIPIIRGYEGKLHQVFMNLLSNAIHAIENQGDIWIRTDCIEGRVRIVIRDNGTGISKHHLGKIFEPFFTTKIVGQGTGLGLSISYGIIKQHGGEIQVESEAGQGSAFTVILPVQPMMEQGSP